jgi:hypothetical protein
MQALFRRYAGAIQALLRLYSGKALFRRYEGAIKALLRLYSGAMKKAL